MTHAHREVVVLRQLACIAHGEVTRGAFVGEIFRDNGVEIMTRHAARCRRAQHVLPPVVLYLCEAICRVVTSSGENELSVEAGIARSRCVELDNAAHLSTVLGWKASGVDTHRIEIVSFDLRAKAWRAIVGQRNAVDDKLCLVLRTAWVQYRISFIDPPWLQVHQILY